MLKVWARRIIRFGVISVKASIERHERIRGKKLQRINRRILRAQPLCVLCREAGRVKAATQVDHIVPLFKGGTNDVTNLQPLCWECHNNKSIHERFPRPVLDEDGWPRGRGES